jgi:hypothetical protein
MELDALNLSKLEQNMRRKLEALVGEKNEFQKRFAEMAEDVAVRPEWYDVKPLILDEMKRESEKQNQEPKPRFVMRVLYGLASVVGYKRNSEDSIQIMDKAFRNITEDLQNDVKKTQGYIDQCKQRYERIVSDIGEITEVLEERLSLYSDGVKQTEVLKQQISQLKAGELEAGEEKTVAEEVQERVQEQMELGNVICSMGYEFDSLIKKANSSKSKLQGIEKNCAKAKKDLKEVFGLTHSLRNTYDDDQEVKSILQTYSTNKKVA